MKFKTSLLVAALLASCTSQLEPIVDAIPEQPSSSQAEDEAASWVENDIGELMGNRVNRFAPGVDVECFDVEEAGDAFIKTQVIVSPTRSQVFTMMSGQIDSASAQDSYMVVDNGRMVSWDSLSPEVTEILLREQELNEHVLPFGEFTTDGLTFPGYFVCKEWNYDANAFKHPTPTESIDLRELGGNFDTKTMQ